MLFEITEKLVLEMGFGLPTSDPSLFISKNSKKFLRQADLLTQ